MAAIVRFPSPPLDTYVDRIYYMHGEMPYPRERILPDSMLDLKINFGGTIRAYAADQPEPVAVCVDSWSVGLWNAYHIVEWPQNLELFGVFFKPGGAYPFLQIPASELHNNVVSLDTIWSRFAAEIRERLHAAPTIEAGLALLEQLLLDRLCAVPPSLDVVQFALSEIARHQGTLSIQALSDHIGISQNHLGNLFKALVGGTPKEVARLHRFHHALGSVDPTQPIDWTVVAHRAMYYDQSHFNKDFATFTGHSPTDYLRLRRKVHDENPHHAHYIRELPAD